MEDKILLPMYSGAGDSLQFSTLPRRFSELGHKVYLSSKATFRNEEIRKLVWYSNPYLELELSDAEPNIGDGAGIKYKNKTDNFIGNWEFMHGLEPDVNASPEIYYWPKPIEDYNEKIIVDLSFYSLGSLYDPKEVKRFVKNQYHKEDVMVMVLNNGISTQLVNLEGYEVLFVRDIFHYCDILHSCQKFVCLFSGGVSLSAALQFYGKFKTDCIMVRCPEYHIMDMKVQFIYDNINYRWI